MSVVEFQSVSRRFGAFEALRQLSLTIRQGDIYGLLGLNGAGKTTSLRILLGLLRHDSGEVSIFGKRRAEHGMSLGDRLGATIEAPAFYPHLSGLDNLNLLRGLASDRKRCREPHQLLEWVGIAEAARVKVRKYSMGMLQRLYLAQALLSRPDLLVLDEPTSNLDPRGILDTRQLIQRLNREEGVTVLLSSHQLNEVEGLCNRVAILNRGRRVIESGVRELFEGEECRVAIQVDRPVEALARMQAFDGCADSLIKADIVETKVKRARRSELNALLVREGFAVSEFVERKPTLEDFFHQTLAEDRAEEGR